MATLDTHAIARSLTDALATKADLAALEARLYRAMLLQAGAIVGAVVAILRMLGDGQ